MKNDIVVEIQKEMKRLKDEVKRLKKTVDKFDNMSSKRDVWIIPGIVFSGFLIGFLLIGAFSR